MHNHAITVTKDPHQLLSTYQERISISHLPFIGIRCSPFGLRFGVEHDALLQMSHERQ